MRNTRKPIGDTGEIDIEFDSLTDEFADAEDFDESVNRFANENDFDEPDEIRTGADDYDEDAAGVYGSDEKLKKPAKKNYSNSMYAVAGDLDEDDLDDEDLDDDIADEIEDVSSESVDENITEEDIAEFISDEEYFDDHVEYFYDDEFAESGSVVLDDEFGSKASAKTARSSVEAAGGVRVHKKPIVKVEDDSKRRPVRNAQSEAFEETDEDFEEDEDTKKPGGAIEKLMIALAACVVLALIVVGGYMIIRKPFAKPVSNINENGIAYNPELGGAGSQLAGIDVIGGTGLAAAYEARIGGEFVPDVVDIPDDDVEIYEEIDYTNEVEVSFETVSVVKDLKIKFINKKTGKLIANVPFVVTVTTPSGTIQTWSDSDKDGIIYYSDIAAGTYKLHLEELDATKYAGYVLPADIKPDVRSEIAYERVDVSGEILGVGDINEATEDTIRDGADAGNGTLSNTVAFVESSKKDSYTALTDTAAIIMPFSLSSLDYNNSIIVVAEGEDGNVNGDTGDGGDTGNTGNTENPGETPAATGSMTLSAESITVKVNEVAGADITVTTTGAAAPTVTAGIEGTAATIDSCSNSKITVKGVAEGTATVTLTLKDGDKVLAEKKVTVTVTSNKGTIAINKTTLGVLAGKAATAQVTLTNITAADVTVASSQTGVATAALAEDGKLTITGVAAGTANITVTQTADSTVTATLAVTVYAGTDKLTATVNGKTVQLYIQTGNDSYREATYMDCTANPFPTFYYANSIYTGWQTIDGKTYYYTAEGKAVTGEQVINGVLYNFDSTGALVAGNGTLGIDVSKWNGDINWSKVKAAGVSYVIIRIGYRGSTLGGLIDDANFKKNIEGAQAAGLKIGVYFVTQAINDAEAVYEASMVLDRISKYTISYPVFLDVEASGGRGDKIDVATRTSVCKTFCKTIQNAGYTAGIYANKSWLTTKIDASQLTGYKIWVAQYYTSCTYSGSYSMWQYTDSGTIDGISGKVDLNKSYLGY